MNHIRPAVDESFAALKRLPTDFCQRSRTHILQHLELHLCICPVSIDLPESQASAAAFPQGRPARKPVTSHACVLTILIEELHLRHIASPHKLYTKPVLRRQCICPVCEVRLLFSNKVPYFYLIYRLFRFTNLVSL